MTNQQMEDLVERIIQRLRPPVLVMVTAAAGYRQAIRQRLAGCGDTSVRGSSRSCSGSSRRRA